MTVSLHPGVVNTEIILKIANKFILLKLLIYLLYPFLWFMMKTPKMGAQTSLYCCLEDNLKLVGGGYYVDCKIGQVSEIGGILNEAQKVWDYSEEQIKKK
jgi:hypothetical protein